VLCWSAIPLHSYVMYKTRCYKQNFKNYNFSQNAQRAATDLPVTCCHTGIEGEGMYSCNPFSILALEGDGVNAIPCPILTILQVKVYCLCHVFNVLIFVSIFFSLILVEHLSKSTVWSSVFGSILKCKIPSVSEELVPFPSKSEFKMVHNFGILEHYYITCADCFNVGDPNFHILFIMRHSQGSKEQTWRFLCRLQADWPQHSQYPNWWFQLGSSVRLSHELVVGLHCHPTGYKMQ